MLKSSHNSHTPCIHHTTSHSSHIIAPHNPHITPPYNTKSCTIKYNIQHHFFAEFSNQQLIAVATRIRQSGGVVIADELAPYLDPPVYKGPQVVYDGTTRGYKSYVVSYKFCVNERIRLRVMLYSNVVLKF